MKFNNLGLSLEELKVKVKNYNGKIGREGKGGDILNRLSIIVFLKVFEDYLKDFFVSFLGLAR